MSRRSLRDDSAPVRAMELTMATRVAVVFERMKMASLTLDLVVSGIELLAVAFYFEGMEYSSCDYGPHAAGRFFPPSSSTAEPPTLGVTSQLLPEHLVYASGLHSLFFIGMYVVMFVLAANRQKLATSMYTFLSAVTAIPMGLAYVSYMARGGPAAHAMSSWSPSFLRVWFVHWRVGTMLSKHFRMLHPAIKEIIGQGMLTLSLIVNFMAMIQFFESVGAPCTKSSGLTFYMVMISITTVGYGDQVAETMPGQATVAVMIFIAMFMLPTIIGKLQELFDFLRSQNTYASLLPHVIVCGEFRLVDLKVVLQEFLPDTTTSLNVVLVTEQPLDEHSLRWLSQPSLRSRVTVCVSDVVRKGQILRFRARSAIAVFLVSPRAGIAQRGDYTTMMKSIVFHRYEPQTPQYLLLKRGMHTAAMRRTANVIFERERLKFYLMGVALRLPLFVPFMINLLKSSSFLDVDTMGSGADKKTSSTRKTGDVDEQKKASSKGGEGRRGLRRRGPSPASSSSPPRGFVGRSDKSDDDDNDHRRNDEDEELHRALQNLNVGGVEEWNWWKLYLRGAVCNLYVVAIPVALQGRLFSSAVLIVHARLNVTVIGLVRRNADIRETTTTVIAPMRSKLMPSDKFIVIAPCTIDPAKFVSLYHSAPAVRVSSHTQLRAPPTDPSGSYHQHQPIDGGGDGEGDSSSSASTSTGGGTQSTGGAPSDTTTSSSSSTSSAVDSELVIGDAGVARAVSHHQPNMRREHRERRATKLLAAPSNDPDVGGPSPVLDRDTKTRAAVHRKSRHHRSDSSHGGKARGANTAYPFKDHLLLIDLASPTESASLNAEEAIESAQFQALDMVRLLRGVIQLGEQDVHVPVVFLSGQSLSDQFTEAWPAACRPIYHLRGFGAEYEHLEAAGAAAARAIVVFFSVECERRDSVVHLVANLLNDILNRAGREKTVPVILEVDDMALAHLLPPRLSPSVDDNIVELAREHYSCSPSYFTGHVISSTMVDTMLLQCTYNASLPSIVHALLGIRQDDGDLLTRVAMDSRAHLQRGNHKSKGTAYPSHMLKHNRKAAKRSAFHQDVIYSAPVVEFFPMVRPLDVVYYSYGDLIALSVADDCVPLGLQRRIDTDIHGSQLIGTRCFLTNPPHSLALKSDDEVYYIFVADAAA